jgi:hypothetical protein
MAWILSGAGVPGQFGRSDWAEICFLSLELMTVMTRFWFKKPEEIASNAFRDAFNFEANALSTHPHHEP